MQAILLLYLEIIIQELVCLNVSIIIHMQKLKQLIEFVLLDVYKLQLVFMQITIQKFVEFQQHALFLIMEKMILNYVLNNAQIQLMDSLILQFEYVFHSALHQQ